MLTTAPRAVLQSRRSVGESLRLHVLLLLTLAVAIPALVFSLVLHRPFFTVAQLNNSIIGAALAIILANYFLRRMTAFPGVRTFRYILPCNGLAYGGVLAVILIARISYSSVFLTISFVLSFAVATALRYWLERTVPLRFYIVPHGRTGLADDLRKADWVVLREAKLPADARTPIVADLHHDLPDEWERMLADAALRGQPVYHIKLLRESLTGQVSIEHLSENSFGSLIPDLAYAKLKRLLDVAACLTMLPLLILPCAALALAIRLESPGPSLFRQIRMGAGGREFQVLKFRSMSQQSTDYDGNDRRAAMTLNDDARITRIGRFIRRTRIDELPQLVNVLRGEMSLIGPRPEALPLSQWYEAELPFYVYRHIVRPGITGWAQVNQGHVTNLENVNTKLNYDFYYIKNFSAWLDILIAIRTVGIIFSGFGSK